MAFARRSGQRFTANIWPGFVDAMTALLLVLIFVLSIFMIVQSVLRTTVSTQEHELDDLSAQVTSLASALGIEQQRTDQLETEVTTLDGQLDEAASRAAAQDQLIASLTSARDAAQGDVAAKAAQIADFEAQVASLLAQNSDLTANLDNTQIALDDTAAALSETRGNLDTQSAELEASNQALTRARADITALEEAARREISQKEALQLALARARDEIDAASEAARLAAARREALDALILDLQGTVAQRDAALADAGAQLAETNAAVEAEAARRKALDAIIAALRVEMADTSARLSETETKAAAAEKALAEQGAAADQNAASLAENREELAAAQSALEEARRKLSSQEANLAETLVLLSASRDDLAAARARLAANGGDMEALRADLARAEDDLSAAEAARLAEATALAAMQKRLENTEAQLSDAEIARIADAAAAQALQERLLDADAELTAMSLNLEAQRQKAEDTLDLLAAAEIANKTLRTATQDQLDARQAQRARMAQAGALLAEERTRSAKATREISALNQQAAALRSRLRELQGLLDDASGRNEASDVQIELLGQNLNNALAELAAEQKKLKEAAEARAALEERERLRLEEEAVDLRRYRSEFFGRVGEILSARDGVEIVGDRFVFSSEVLFAPGSAELGQGGRQQIAKVAAVLRDVADEIPPEINWILRVDGHTDRTPLGGFSAFADNWELSQARALSVVRYLVTSEGIPPNRLTAAGFGEFQPIDPGDTLEALANNRRIELKFTEK